MTRVANPFRYMLREPYGSVSCIFKAWFGSSYFIWKAKALHQTVNTMAKDIDQRLRLGTKPDDIWRKVINKITSGRVTIFEVEVLMESEVPSELLIEEKRLLTMARKDDKCLNAVFDPYIPKWIPQEEIDKYLDAIRPKPKPATKQTGKGKKTLIRRPGKKNSTPAREARKRSKNASGKKAYR